MMTEGSSHAIILAADVGATKTNLALFKYEHNDPIVLHYSKFKSNDYSNVIDLINEFQKDLPSPDSICLAVAGPVQNNHAKLTNLAWEIDREDLIRHFKIPGIHLINDLEATAYGLPLLRESDFSEIHKGENTAGNIAIIAPGTGLGEAGLYWDGEQHHPFATEGGHCDFAPRNKFDFELYSFIQKKFGHVSWERLICGPGILNIYQFLRDEKKREEPAWLAVEFENADAAIIISRNFHKCEICKETMRLFIGYLAHESANLVLKFKATGGLFIGGGIAPQITSLLQDDIFFSSFCQSGRLSYLLEKITVKIILNTRTALLGAADYGQKKSAQTANLQ